MKSCEIFLLLKIRTMATNFSPCKGSYVLNQFPSNVMFGMNGFLVSASGAIQGHHGPLVYEITLQFGDSYFLLEEFKSFVGKQKSIFFCRLFCSIIRWSDNMLKSRWTHYKQCRRTLIFLKTWSSRHHLVVHLRFTDWNYFSNPDCSLFFFLILLTRVSLFFTRVSLSWNNFGEMGASGIIWPKLYIQPRS